MVVSEAGRFITGRNYPILTAVKCSIVTSNSSNNTITTATTAEETQWLQLSAPDDSIAPLFVPTSSAYLPTMEPTSTPIAADPTPTTISVVVWRSNVPAEDMGDIAADWFRHILGPKAGNVRFVRASDRVAPRLVAEDESKLSKCLAPETDATTCIFQSQFDTGTIMLY